MAIDMNSPAVMQAPPAGQMPNTPAAPMGAGLADTMRPEEEMGGAAPGVQDIIQLLLDGVDPEALLQQGVPIELIREAVDIILKEADAQPDAMLGAAGSHMDNDDRAI